MKNNSWNNKLLSLLANDQRTKIWLSRQLHCSHTLVYSWFNGQRNVTSRFKSQIAKLFSVDAEWLWGTGE